MSEVILSVRDITLTYPGAVSPTLEAVSLEVVAGATVGIVGESGSGKSTLAKVAVGLLRPDSGEAEVEGVPWSQVGPTDPRRRKVQMIFQDPYGSLNPGLTALDAVSEAVKVTQGATRTSARNRAVDLLAEVGLAGERIHHRPGRLSGGQCQRVAIARALACTPSVLVADEPTSALDMSVQAQVLNLLHDLCAAHGLALVLISHDLDVVRYLTRECHVMHRGRVVESGPTDEVFEHPRDAYTRMLIGDHAGLETR